MSLRPRGIETDRNGDFAKERANGEEEFSLVLVQLLIMDVQ